MKRVYLFIPLSLEPLLQSFQRHWFRLSQDAYIICTGNYSNIDNGLDGDSSIVTQSKYIIPYVITGFNGEKTYLNGWIIESNEKDLPTLPDEVVKFYDVVELLNYIK